jgi:hypothetical protein
MTTTTGPPAADSLANADPTLIFVHPTMHHDLVHQLVYPMVHEPAVKRHSRTGGRSSCGEVRIFRHSRK